MVTTTYVLLVLVLAALVWRAGTNTRGLARRGRRPGAARRTGGGRLRALLAGEDPDDDLVERMAQSLVAGTTAFGSSHAVPGHLGADLPAGVYEAAAAHRGRLTAEVVERSCALMAERSRRLGRPAFVLAEDYVLCLTLTRGEEETLTASFEPVREPATGAGRAADARPAAVTGGVTRRPPPGAGGATRRRAARGGPGRTVLLTVDGTLHASRHLDEDTPTATVGRGIDAELRCPEDLVDVSRAHAELTLVDGCCYVEDASSANGSRLVRPDGETVRPAPGEVVAWGPGDVLWLDDEGRAAVTVR